VARAQQDARVRRIGVLMSHEENDTVVEDSPLRIHLGTAGVSYLVQPTLGINSRSNCNRFGAREPQQWSPPLVAWSMSENTYDGKKISFVHVVDGRLKVGDQTIGKPNRVTLCTSIKNSPMP
jgi:hypothetical protein